MEPKFRARDEDEDGGGMVNEGIKREGPGVGDERNERKIERMKRVLCTREEMGGRAEEPGCCCCSWCCSGPSSMPRENRVAGGSEGVRGGIRGGYQERTSQDAARWRIIIVASSVSRILERKDEEGKKTETK